MTARDSQTRLLLIGLGNPDRADDGIGPLVAARLGDRDLCGARVIARTGDVLALIEDWAGADAVVMIDAADTLSRPGRIHRIDLAREDLPSGLAFPSTHAFGMSDAVALARTLQLLPRHIIVYAVEGACFDAGAAMSAEVTAAAAEVADLVSGELKRLRQLEEHAYA
jgi:hydrogenase maturation protease